MTFHNKHLISMTHMSPFIDLCSLHKLWSPTSTGASKGHPLPQLPIPSLAVIPALENDSDVAFKITLIMTRRI